MVNTINYVVLCIKIWYNANILCAFTFNLLLLGVALLSEKICCFAGHSDVCGAENLYKKLNDEIEFMILNNNVKEFWVGNYGQFDMLAAKCVRILKNRYKDIKLTLVVPYLTKKMNDFKEQYYEDYDDILMPKESNYLICYVKYSYGGAAKTLKYAKKHNIEIVNINDFSFS